MFQGVEKGYTGNKWVNMHFATFIKALAEFCHKSVIKSKLFSLEQLQALI